MLSNTTISKPRITRTLTLLVLALLTWHFYRHGIFLSITPPKHQQSKIAKVTVLANALSNSSYISRALRTHEVQNDLHNYRHFQCNTSLIQEASIPGRPTGTWSKPAYLLDLLLSELSRLVASRLEWFFWFDADTIILNPHISLETFLPPATLFPDIHLLLAENWDGINAGVFPIRVHPWSVTLLNAMLSYPLFRDDEHLEFQDQSALSNLLHRFPEFQMNWTVVPHRWFNSFPVNSVFDNGSWIYADPMDPKDFDDGERPEQGDLAPWKVLKGDMAVHFAGTQERESWMVPWVERAEMLSPEWTGPQHLSSLAARVDHFWEEERSNIEVRNREILELGTLERVKERTKLRLLQNQEGRVMSTDMPAAPSAGYEMVA
ncbi:hypothetical protein LTR10_016809 [Elasticomyces elasticus]|uniref:Galactosyl transferase GMA12/MNN10 family protein n=1 Tax=Exophiala sideris TaxID=1016849 RepID=A0ABR0JNE1_9EURO|nr:hypothetical protein LTR10_016809 [Elasticomyces elasticus]KAK5037812.1 hypothetical protein LTS07_001279 [Exophiala sideris]KAK5043795.1 hypothetical protein LTR13_000149 [Exophiala sideris]KAK5067294.1 hypothetical protein LTR69_001281 [Exophiala sideris]KAK5182627.1 hypothetical protein LTR44_005018 [Eurotiomycetes sp. CCFEE 6388]